MNHLVVLVENVLLGDFLEHLLVGLESLDGNVVLGVGVDQVDLDLDLGCAAAPHQRVLNRVETVVL